MQDIIGQRIHYSYLQHCLPAGRVSVPLKMILLHVLVWSCFLIPSAVNMKNEVSRNSITSVLTVIPESVMSCQLNWLPPESHQSLVLAQQFAKFRQCTVNHEHAHITDWKQKSWKFHPPTQIISLSLCPAVAALRACVSPESRDSICFLQELPIPSFHERELWLVTYLPPFSISALLLHYSSLWNYLVKTGKWKLGTAEKIQKN